MSEQRIISFSPPDIGEEEIAEVVDTLKSGWITTGPKTKRFEQEIASFTGAEGAAGFSSATAAMECALRALGIGEGDEVIVPAYTYTASASPIYHVGATPVMVDIAQDSFEIDYESLPQAITGKTKAIIPVDIAGRMCDYDALQQAIDSAGKSWTPTNEMQESIGRIAIVADGAHAFGATRKGVHAGAQADLTAFSFHAVKNLTTAEGGALSWKSGLFDSEALYKQLMLMALHGQTKDALAKTKAGAWEYDIAFPGWKCNMTDIQAALGLAQLRRYPSLLARRKQIIAQYEAGLASLPVTSLQHYGDDFQSSGHLMLVNLTSKSQGFRNALIEQMAQLGVATNVHYKPLPLLSAYKDKGFNGADYPNSLQRFENEITLPLHTLLSDEDVQYVIQTFGSCYSQLEAKGIC